MLKEHYRRMGISEAVYDYCIRAVERLKNCFEEIDRKAECDQLKVFGDAVRHFREMPEPRADGTSIAFARQAAREAMAAAAGAC